MVITDKARYRFNFYLLRRYLHVLNRAVELEGDPEHDPLHLKGFTEFARKRIRVAIDAVVTYELRKGAGLSRIGTVITSLHREKNR